MKKIIAILSLVLVVGFIGTFAYAQGFGPVQNDEDNWIQWHEDRMEWKKSQVDESLKEGLISEEQAKDWNDHFRYMEEFHRENGFSNGYGCHGNRNRGMMRANRW